MKQSVLTVLIIVLLISTTGFCHVAPILRTPDFDTGGDSPLRTSYTWEGNGSAIVEALAIDGEDNPSGIITIDSIPDTSTIVYAFFAATGWHNQVHTASGLLNGNQLPAIMPTAFDNGDSYDLSYYRWDITNQIEGNGEFSFSLINFQQCYVAFIVVVYENLSMPLVSIVLNDGSESLHNASSTTEFSGLPQGNGNLKIISQAGDSDYNDSEWIEFNGQMLTNQSAVFTSNIGDHADYHEFNLTMLQNTNLLTTTTGDDWLGFHLAILIGGMDLPPPFSMTLSPVNPPIIIPANGGSFSFDISLANDEPYPVTFDVWSTTILPDGSDCGPQICALNQTAAPNQTLDINRSQEVPSRAESGVYTYCTFVGVYPDIALAEDQFEFEKSSIIDGSELVTNWDIRSEVSGGISAVYESLPERFELLPAYPNPFNQQAVISFVLQTASFVNLRVFDVTGREVESLVSGHLSSGMHEVIWDSEGLGSGVYFVRLSVDSQQSTVRKVVLMK